MTFERKNALWSAKAAKRTVRRHVGRDNAAANANIWAVVRASGMNCAARENDGRERQIRAAVESEINIHPEEFAVARYGRAMARAGGVAFCGGNHVFRAIVDNFDRLS